MFPRCSHTFWLQGFVLLVATAPLGAQSSTVIRLPWPAWETHLTDDLRCAAINDPGCVWQGPEALTRDDVDLWQRIDVTLPEELKAPQQLGLLVQDAYPVYEVFVNGHRIGGSGSFENRNGPADPRAVLAFPSTLAQDGHIVIALHTLHLYAGWPPTGFPPALGQLQQIRAQSDLDAFSLLRETVQRDLCMLLILCVCPFFLVFYLMDRKAWEYLWIWILLGGYALFAAAQFLDAHDAGLNSTTAITVVAFCVPLYRIAYIEFPFALMGKRVTLPFRLLEALLVAMLIQLLVLLPMPMHALQSLALASDFVRSLNNYGEVVSNAAWLMVLPICFKSRRPEMKWIGTAMAFMAVMDVDTHLGFINSSWVGWNSFSALLSTFTFRAYAYLAFAVAMLFAMAARFRRTELRNHVVEQELAAAAAVQSLLLSSVSGVHRTFAVEAVYLPAGEVGGDFFYTVPDESRGDSPGARESESGGLLVIVGDVSGKGLKAALTVSAIVGALRDHADHRPSAVLEHLNRVLCGQISGFVTCCATHIANDGTMVIANAGHPAPYLNGTEIETAPGLPLGVVVQSAWPEQSLRLGRDDRLTFISDGVVEASRPDGELFGFERAKAVSTQPAESIAASAKAFGAGAPQADDITVLAITRRLATA
jgi:sigma-B regulation protein RsbU (phosphoserine phosphatase)